jgi:hypothetical protein
VEPFTFETLLNNVLISVEGTRRIPQGGMEPPRRYAPAGSPYNRYFPQESRTFHYNQRTVVKKSTPYFNTTKKKKYLKH